MIADTITLVLGSPGAWFVAGAYSRRLEPVPRKGPLVGTSLTSPARRLAERSDGLPLRVASGAIVIRSKFSPKGEAGGKKEKAEMREESETNGAIMDNTCATCRAFYSNETFGQCRLHPQMVPKRPDEWCLDWQAKGTPRSKALAPTTDEFDRFWAEYPRRIGKKAAQKAFQNARDRPRIDDLLQAIHRAKQSVQWLKDGGQFIPHPATWLNRGQWADVPVEAKPSVFEEFLARGEEHDEIEG